MKTLIIIPAYNEELNIENVIKELNRYDYEYLIINDCSKDNTEEICKNKGMSYLSLPINLGIGGGVQAGYKYALKNGYDIAIQHDGDGQHDPKYLKDVIEPIEKGEADIVIGSRFVTKEGFQSTGSRRLGIKILSALIYICTGTKVKDVTSGYRAVNKEYIKYFSEYYPSDYPEPEAIADASLNGAKIKEVPVIMKEREYGVSSINLKKSIYYMIKVSLAIVICRLTNRKKNE